MCPIQNEVLQFLLFSFRQTGIDFAKIPKFKLKKKYFCYSPRLCLLYGGVT